MSGDAILTFERPIAIDLFSGAGGMSLGLEQAGFDIALAVDRDGHHVAVHERNFPYGISLCMPIEKMSKHTVTETLGKLDVDLVCGGPPCQGFSNMGIRDSSDPRNSLVREFIRIVCELRPKAFLMENVPGMNSGTTYEIYCDAIEMLSSADYAITEPVKTLDASDFGVPQRRSRLFVVGIRNDIDGTFHYPAGPDPAQAPTPTVANALGGLPHIEDEDKLFKRDIHPYGNNDPSKLHPYAAAMLGVQRDASDYSRTRTWRESMCTGCMKVRHSKKSIQLYSATKPGAMVPGHKLPRLHPDGLAPTLRAGSESEHGSYTAPRPVHYSYPRCITPREAARLHGYPDWFRFYPSKAHAARQIGNSVCPPVAKALGKQILTALKMRPMRPLGSIELTDKFKLPDNRPRQKRRITQTEEWPKIISHLFDRALDESGRLTSPDFSVADVESAYVATNANVPRNPASRFLSDVARSRNRVEILRCITDRGYSIQLIDRKEAYGRFVAADVPGTLEKKSLLSISSKEIAESIELAGISGADISDPTIALYAKTETFQSTLFPEEEIAIEIQKDLFDGVLDGPYFFDAIRKNEKRRGVLIVSRGTNPPTIPEIVDLANAKRAEVVLVLSRLTKEHFGAILLGIESDGLPHEISRAVFRVPNSQK